MSRAAFFGSIMVMEFALGAFFLSATQHGVFLFDTSLATLACSSLHLSGISVSVDRLLGLATVGLRAYHSCGSS